MAKNEKSKNFSLKKILTFFNSKKTNARSRAFFSRARTRVPRFFIIKIQIYDFCAADEFVRELGAFK